VSRFSQAISEGDGISVIPVLEGDVGELAALAEQAGAEAIAVTAHYAADVRTATALPLVVDDIRTETELSRLVQAGADGCTIVFDLEAGEGELIDDLYPAVASLDLDCAVEVRDEDALADVLERVDPEMLIIASARVDDEDELEHVLDLLPDIPAGKLVIARARLPITREQVVALERAGVDGIFVGAKVLREPDFAAALAELTGRSSERI
jgi:indole-3-glycerol phosphate synthase